jgi:hypothetical protein
MTLVQEPAAVCCDQFEQDHEDARSLVVRPILPDESAEWDNGLAGSPQDCVFMSSSWLDLVGEAFGWRIARLGCYQFDRLVGGLTGRIIEAGQVTALDRLLLVPYNGCWIGEGSAQLRHRVEHRAQAVLSALAGEATRRFGSVVLDLHPANRDARPFTWGGWNAAVRYTFVNDLTRCEESALAPSVRRRVKRASAAGVRFDSEVVPDEFMQIWSLALRRQGLREPVPADAVRRLLDRLPDQQFGAEICGARLADGRLVAANVVLYDRTTAYYWLAGFDSDEPHHWAANQFCHVETLRHAARLATRFDWVGANTRTVAEYKQSFGPELIPYSRVTWNRAQPEMAKVRPPTTLGRWLRSCPILKMSD